MSMEAVLTRERRFATSPKSGVNAERAPFWGLGVLIIDFDRFLRKIFLKFQRSVVAMGRRLSRNMNGK